MLEYNVPGGKLNRGLTVVHTYVDSRWPLQLACILKRPPSPLKR